MARLTSYPSGSVNSGATKSYIGLTASNGKNSTELRSYTHETANFYGL